MNQNVENLSAELIKAVNVILNPCVPNTQRLEAHKVSFFLNFLLNESSFSFFFFFIKPLSAFELTFITL